MQSEYKRQYFILFTLLILFFLVVGESTVFFSDWIEYSKQTLLSVDPKVAVLIVILLKASTVIVAPLSGAVLYGIVGIVFPFWWAVATLSVGNAIGIIASYRLGKQYGRKIIEYIGGRSWVDQGQTLLAKMHSRQSFLLVRLSLFFAEDILNYLGGMAKVGFISFFVISMSATTVLMLGILLGVDGIMGLLFLF